MNPDDLSKHHTRGKRYIGPMDEPIHLAVVRLARNFLHMMVRGAAMSAELALGGGRASSLAQSSSSSSISSWLDTFVEQRLAFEGLTFNKRLGPVRCHAARF